MNIDVKVLVIVGATVIRSEFLSLAGDVSEPNCRWLARYLPLRSLDWNLKMKLITEFIGHSSTEPQRIAMSASLAPECNELKEYVSESAIFSMTNFHDGIGDMIRVS